MALPANALALGAALVLTACARPPTALPRLKLHAEKVHGEPVAGASRFCDAHPEFAQRLTTQRALSRISNQELLDRWGYEQVCTDAPSNIYDEENLRRGDTIGTYQRALHLLYDNIYEDDAEGIRLLERAAELGFDVEDEFERLREQQRY